MSDHEEERPLTRRERRMQEMAATGALDLSEVAEHPTGQPTPVEESTDDADASIAEEIEISPVNEDGTPRSRREMRQLREEALARLEASRAAAAEESAPAAEEPVAEEPAAAVEGEAAEPEADAAEAEVVESDAAEAEVVEPEAGESDAAEAEAEAAEPEVVAPEAIEAEPVAAVDSEPVVEEVEPEAPAEDGGAPAEAADEPAAETVAFDASELADAESATPAVESAPEEGVDFDTLISPPTEAFTVEELAEAESAGSSDAADAAAVDAEPVVAVPVVEAPAVADVPADEKAPADGATPVEGAKSKLRFPWKRNKSEEGAATTDGEAVEMEAVPAEPDAVEAEPAAGAPEPAAVEAEIVSEPAPVEAEEIPEAVAADPEPASPEAPQTYSFPDIAPPEEWRSVFDDPTPRKLPGQKADGDFDDLISRAVAQESTASSNTSALILPTMPEDTGGLTGPLGATGDLYVTGSLKLPKSLGETGGHAALQDSVEVDPISGMPDEDPHVTAEQTGLAPVAARHAVSAQVTSSIPVVAKPVKERNKLPLVLSLTGGGLLVVVDGIGVVGATQGWFG